MSLNIKWIPCIYTQNTFLDIKIKKINFLPFLTDKKLLPMNLVYIFNATFLCKTVKKQKKLNPTSMKSVKEKSIQWKAFSEFFPDRKSMSANCYSLKKEEHFPNKR